MKRPTIPLMTFLLMIFATVLLYIIKDYRPHMADTVGDVVRPKTRKQGTKKKQFQFNKNNGAMLANPTTQGERSANIQYPLFLGCHVVSSLGHFIKLDVLLQAHNASMASDSCVVKCEERNFHLAAILVSSRDCYCSNFTPGILGVPCRTQCEKDGPCDKRRHLHFYKTSHRIKEVNTTCGVISLAEPGTWKPVTLTSFPGCGNTWTRHLLEYTTGQFTGSTFNDWSIYKGGYIGEFEDVEAGTTIVIKTHRFLHNCTGIILLIRNPYDAILAQFNLKLTGSHVRRLNGKNWPVNEWRQFTVDNIKRWSDLVFQCLLGGPETIVVHYENILKDPPTEIRRMVKFLTGAYPADDRLQCTVRWQEGLFHRKLKTKRSSDYYTEDVKDLFNRHITAVAMALQAYKKDSLKNNYSPNVSPSDKWPLLEGEMSRFAKRILNGYNFIYWKQQLSH